MKYWDERYQSEGEIWGDLPSPTVTIASKYINPNSRVLDIGCGYGRDLSFLIRKGYMVTGIDSSRLAVSCYKNKYKNLYPEYLINKRFEEIDFPANYFDGIISHRVLHLLINDKQISNFLFKISHILRKGGMLCIGVRNINDYNPNKMSCVGNKVYEYRNRPGHKIRFWDEKSIIDYFSDYFNIKDIKELIEKESLHNPVPCHLTIMVAERK